MKPKNESHIINELQSRTIVPKEKTHEKTHIIISDLEDYSTKPNQQSQIIVKKESVNC